MHICLCCASLHAYDFSLVLHGMYQCLSMIIMRNKQLKAGSRHSSGWPTHRLTSIRDWLADCEVSCCERCIYQPSFAADGKPRDRTHPQSSFMTHLSVKTDGRDGCLQKLKVLQKNPLPNGKHAQVASMGLTPYCTFTHGPCLLLSTADGFLTVYRILDSVRPPPTTLCL